MQETDTRIDAKRDGPQQIVLASASPRRRELLGAAGIPFEAIPSGIEEQMQQGETAEQFCRRVASEKAHDVASRLPGNRRIVVGADTIVVLGNEVLGKPRSHEEAAAMLRSLSGRSHDVLTGICVIDPVSGTSEERAVRTEVRFAPMTEEEILEYVATGEPMDKAGAYAIQGRASRFVERIDGCYFNVVGLPVPELYRLLKRLMKSNG